MNGITFSFLRFYVPIERAWMPAEPVLTGAPVLVFRDISMRVRRRFPTLQYVVDAGFMEPEELDQLESVNCNPGQKYWVPINWANSLALDAHQKKLIDQPTAFNNLILVGFFMLFQFLSQLHLGVHLSQVNALRRNDSKCFPYSPKGQNDAIKEFRVAMETLIKFDSVPIPIAYPQVVFLAVRVYFTLCIISRQFLVSSDMRSKTQMDWPVPIMTCLEFIFVIGWMKVAEVLLNPLGEDDDDFEVNWIIDKNISTGMAIVDNTHAYHPGLVNDKFADPSKHHSSSRFYNFAI
uniref:Bestrophin homolog n=2 Tax=Caenorhabditis japonica TaxID=281687 RepID=A0A8R1J0X7_CAEJA